MSLKDKGAISTGHQGQHSESANASSTNQLQTENSSTMDTSSNPRALSSPSKGLPLDHTSTNVATQPTELSVDVEIENVLVVFLGVMNGDDCSLAQISVSNIDDDTFFEKLRTKYYELRKFTHRILSYRVYSHCEFVQVCTLFRCCDCEARC